MSYRRVGVKIFSVPAPDFTDAASFFHSLQNESFSCHKHIFPSVFALAIHAVNFYLSLFFIFYFPEEKFFHNIFSTARKASQNKKTENKKAHLVLFQQKEGGSSGGKKQDYIKKRKCHRFQEIDLNFKQYSNKLNYILVFIIKVNYDLKDKNNKTESAIYSSSSYLMTKWILTGHSWWWHWCPLAPQPCGKHYPSAAHLQTRFLPRTESSPPQAWSSLNTHSLLRSHAACRKRNQN